MLESNGEIKDEGAAGLAALDDTKLRAYVPDLAAFEQFGRTRAYEDYLEYTLRPPFTLQTKLGQKMTMSTSSARSMSWSNYVARQSLRDEAMAGVVLAVSAVGTTAGGKTTKLLTMEQAVKAMTGAKAVVDNYSPPSN